MRVLCTLLIERPFHGRIVQSLCMCVCVCVCVHMCSTLSYVHDSFILVCVCVCVCVCVHMYTCRFLTLYHTSMRRHKRRLIFINSFSQKSPIIRASFAEADLQLKAIYVSSPPCTGVETHRILSRRVCFPQISY